MTEKKTGPSAKTNPHHSSSNRGGTHASTADTPYTDPIAYGNGPDDAITDVNETASITHHTLAINGKDLAYTATAGHLVIVDPSSSQPEAKIFYVAFTADGNNTTDKTARPLTFFYNGGPGSSSVYVLLGSFAPKRIHTAMPSFTPPAPYTLEDNPDSLLDESDLVFINPVGTGYSAAIAPKRNRDFWGVDQDAHSLAQFIKRYLTANDRWNSPKFLFGESYGTARSAVLSYILHEDGVDLNGITLQSSILDYSQAGNPVGLLPTCAYDAWYHNKLEFTDAADAKTPPAAKAHAVSHKTSAPPLASNTHQNGPAPAALANAVAAFADGDYAKALAHFPQIDASALTTLSHYTGIDPALLKSWSLDVAAANSRGNALFLVSLLHEQGLALGSYDGRVTAINTGIAADIDPNSGGNDPTMTAVNGAYTAMWNTYLNEDLKFRSNSAFTDLNDQAFQYWDFHHTDPTGAEKGIDKKGNVVLYTAGDLAATMSLNVDLKVLSANGYYDWVTPFHQTVTDLKNMPLLSPTIRENLAIHFYPSGHMIYLDGGSRTALKADLTTMYQAATTDHAAMSRIRTLQQRKR